MTKLYGLDYEFVRIIPAIDDDGFTLFESKEN